MPITKTKVSYFLDLSQIIGESKRKSDLKRKIADYVLSEIENHTQSQTSPVTSRSFPSLSKKYAEFKKKQGKGSDADLHLNNNMINSITPEFKSLGINFKITDPTEKKKAFNHNTADTVPLRRFLPDDASDSGVLSTFNAKIMEGIRKIVKDHDANKDQGQ